MPTNPKPVAKSLHTISVIVQVARNERQRENLTNKAAIEEAMGILGLAGREDPYGLAAKALAQL